MPVATSSCNRRGLTSVAATILALLAGAGAGSLLLGVSSAAAAPVTCAAGTCSLTFSQAGTTVQEWAVPDGITQATFVVNGAGGGSDTYGGNGGPGGSGAQVTATIPVTGSDSLQLLVGTGGGRTESAQGADGGYGGGGHGGTGTELGAAGGGGGSFVFHAGTPLLIAGGGGGAAVEGLNGGDGGQTGANGGNYESYAGGEGATQSAPGAGGRGVATGANGTGPTSGPGALGEGGAGEEGAVKFAGGGGGGGYYGGGGGGGGGTGSLSNEYSNTGGGGGSSYVVSSGTGVAYSSGGGVGGFGFENFNEESEEVPAEPGSIAISFDQPTMAVSLTASSLSPVPHAAETFTATVSPVPSSGTVAFTEAGIALVGCGAVTVAANGEASCVTEYATAGTHELLAEYSGSTDTIYRASTSAPLEVVATVPTTTPTPPVTCAAGTCSLTFSQAGTTVQEWAVPDGITQATFVVNGAGGGSNTYSDNGGPGGDGAQATAMIPLTGGQELQLLVGTGGERTESAQGADGGYGGGGNGGTGAQLGAPGGGGGSFVFRAGAPLIIAGGGGGAAVEPFPGGNGGQVGANGGSYDEDPGGEGATQSSAGLGGNGLATGASGTGPTTGPGALAKGGAGEGGGVKFAGGGGGGGYYGGGGGGAGGTGSAANEYFNAGGGGGSSYVTSSGADVGYSSEGGGGGVEAGAAEPGSIMISFTQPTTGTSVKATSLSPEVNSAETFTATVSPTPSSGTVAFTEGGSPIASCEAVTVRGGEASCVTEYASPGPHELLAEYSGSTDTVYPASASAPLDILATGPTSTSLGASSVTPAPGASVTFTATVSPVPDSGTVAFKDGSDTIAGCGAVAVDVTTGETTCVTSLSSLGGHAITADFSGSLDGAFEASAAAALSVSVRAPSVTVSTVFSASTSTTPTPLPTTLIAARPAPVFALSILTRETKPLLNRRVLAVRARCGTVSCAVRARMTVKLSGGGGKVLAVSSATTMLPAGEAGNALFAVPSKLRGTVRSYLLHHPHATATLQVTFTASAAGHPSQTAHVALAVSTYGGYR